MFRLRLGSTAPNFKAETTLGLIDFHEWIGDKWAILFSHPEDYTPVCTTELAALAKYEPEFTKRGVKLIGLSANTVETHGGWINDIDEIAGIAMTFPIIGDKDRKIAFAYDMVTPLTSRNPHTSTSNPSSIYTKINSLTTKTQPTSILEELPSQFVRSSSSTRKRRSALSSPTPPQQDATQPNSSE